MPKQINEATPEGFELGYHLARFVDAEEAKGKLADGRERCHNCAFRQGAYPNGSPETTMTALKCAVEGDPFLCHEDLKPCVGWALLRRASGGAKTELAWNPCPRKDYSGAAYLETVTEEGCL
jgi:hypothetical protein